MHRSRDYYEVLGVDRRAADEEIRDAYRRLAREHHPDLNKDDPAAAERFKEVAEAYAVLSDKEKRQAYDRFGHAGVAGATPGGAPDGGWADFAGAGGGDPFSEILEQMFAGGGGGPFQGAGPGGPFQGARTAGSAPPRARRGEDVQRDVKVTFMTAALGGTEPIQVAGPDGSPQRIDLKIPAGVESGQKLRVTGRGRPGVNDGPAGDVIVTVTVGEHPRFHREGLDVFVDVPVTIVEASLGVSVNVPLLKGSVEIKVPPGTGSGRKLRVPGQGIATPQGKRGDFHAVIQIAAPQDLTPRGRELLEELSSQLKSPRGESDPTE